MHCWENGYGDFLGKGVDCGMRLKPIFMGHIQTDGIRIQWLDSLTDVLGKL